MKSFILFLITLTLFSAISKAESSELPVAAQKLVLNAIADHVYAEVNGKIRAPQKTADFSFTVVDSDKVIVSGNSFSELDNKEIGYTCEVEILGREVIESEYDFELLGCELKL